MPITGNTEAGESLSHLLKNLLWVKENAGAKREGPQDHMLECTVMRVPCLTFLLVLCCPLKPLRLALFAASL